MDMTQYTSTGDPEWKLRKHCKAIRENHITVAVMMLALEGIPVDLTLRGEPMPDFARECLNELETDDQIGVWSCSTTAGGIWTPEQRRQLVGRD